MRSVVYITLIYQVASQILREVFVLSTGGALLFTSSASKRTYVRHAAVLQVTRGDSLSIRDCNVRCSCASVRRACLILT